MLNVLSLLVFSIFNRSVSIEKAGSIISINDSHLSLVEVISARHCKRTLTKILLHMHTCICKYTLCIINGQLKCTHTYIYGVEGVGK